ncbi:MAG: hypothetical protein ACNA8W_06975, partial [Bradymonadaceae bacterium]
MTVIITASLTACTEDSTLIEPFDDIAEHDVHSSDAAPDVVDDAIADATDPIDAGTDAPDIEEDTGPTLPPEPWAVTEPGPYRVAYL